MQGHTTERLINSISRDKGLTEILSENREAFIELSLGEYLNLIISKMHMSKARVIRESGINRRYFFDILSGKRRPDRNYVIRILLSVGASFQDAQWLLMATQYPQLYARDKRDCVIIYCFEHRLSAKECGGMLFNLEMDSI